jgi:hypothetical protein
MYIYECTIYHDTSTVVSPPADSAIWVSDFETNYKALATKVDNIQIAETSFLITKTFPDFKALISGAVSWGDVKYIEGHISYRMYLVTQTEL